MTFKCDVCGCRADRVFDQDSPDALCHACEWDEREIEELAAKREAEAIQAGLV